MKSENTLFPGRRNYTGPTKGWFGLLHHSLLCEESHNVLERVDYVKREKPKNEVAVRLHNMIYLGKAGEDYAAKRLPLDAEYAAKHAPHYAEFEAKRAPLFAEYRAKPDRRYAEYAAKRLPLDAEYKAKRLPLDAEYAAKRLPLEAAIHNYIKSHISDCVWDGKELVFST